uniref:Methyltransferase FkbM domain-containing protein n=1 Tax=Rubrivivax gelatinosus S1 TaxID=1138313 RepID=L8BA36_RUBGE|nr:hypothetical protein RGS1_70339 [Rubrivivax gelatinosus S1]
MNHLTLLMQHLGSTPLDMLVVVGAGHDAFERLAGVQARSLVLVDGDPDTAAALQRQAARQTAPRTVRVIAAALAASPGVVGWYRYNVPQLNGPLERPAQLPPYPRLRLQERIDLHAETLEALLAWLPPGEGDGERALILDLPGQEEALLDGLAAACLDGFDHLFVHHASQPGAPGRWAAGLAGAGWEPLECPPGPSGEHWTWLGRGASPARLPRGRAAAELLAQELERLRQQFEAADQRRHELEALAQKLTTQRDTEAHWHQENAKWARGLQSQLAQAQAECTQLRQDIERLRQELEAADGRRDKLEALAKELTTQRDTEAHWHQENAKWARGLQAELAQAQAECAQLRDAQAKHERCIQWLQDVDAGAVPAVRELASSGRLAEAAEQLEQTIEHTANACPPHGFGTRLDVLRSEIGLLRQELALALQRNQLHTGAPAGETSEQRLKRLSTAQLGQDLWVLERTGFKRGGYFVEFGATDGILLSNTLLLENEFGWSGLCAEPNPGMFEQLKINRRCRVSDACVGARTGESVEFVLAEEFGGMVKDMNADMHGDRRQAYYADPRHRQTMITVSLNDLLEQHDAPRDIDYLSIDTEGSEPEILEAFPFDRWRIRLITVEHNYGPNRERLRRLLEPLGYRRTEAQWDDWYELTPPEAT